MAATADTYEHEGRTAASRMQRLKTAVEASRKRLQPYRDNRAEIIKQVIGRHYSDNGAADRVPINLMEFAQTIYTMNLAAGNPQALVNTIYHVLKPRAADLEITLNHELGRMKFGDTLQSCIEDSLQCVGILKTGMEEVDYVEFNGAEHLVGRPYADIVDFDDWVQDAGARTVREFGFCGNRYRLPLEVVRESRIYRKSARHKVMASHYQPTDEDGSERVEAISKPEASEADDEYESFVDLWDLFLPRENVIITVPADGNWDDWLREEEWTGPSNGPFRILNYHRVPNNAMPRAPASLWRDLHELVNILWNKLARQAVRQKSICGVPGAADEDGNRIVKAQDGEMLRLDRPGECRELRYGGPDQINMAFTISAIDLSKMMAGNLDVLGGLSPQSGTVGQDSIINANASKRLAFMQRRVADFTKGACEDIAFYIGHDPAAYKRLSKRPAGLGPEYDQPMTYTSKGYPEEWDLYNFDIDPFSLQYQSPEQKLAKISQFLTQIAIPLAPLLQQQGIGIDMHGVTNLFGRLGNMQAEMSEVLTFVTRPAEEEPQPVEPDTHMPANTNRTYTRVNRPGATQQQKDQMMFRMMMGDRPQASEGASMMRGAG